MIAVIDAGFDKINWEAKIEMCFFLCFGHRQEHRATAENNIFFGFDELKHRESELIQNYHTMCTAHTSTKKPYEQYNSLYAYNDDIYSDENRQLLCLTTHTFAFTLFQPQPNQSRSKSIAPSHSAHYTSVHSHKMKFLLCCFDAFIPHSWFSMEDICACWPIVHRVFAIVIYNRNFQKSHLHILIVRVATAYVYIKRKSNKYYWKSTTENYLFICVDYILHFLHVYTHTHTKTV